MTPRTRTRIELALFLLTVVALFFYVYLSPRSTPKSKAFVLRESVLDIGPKGSDNPQPTTDYRLPTTDNRQSRTLPAFSATAPATVSRGGDAVLVGVIGGTDDQRAYVDRVCRVALPTCNCGATRLVILKSPKQGTDWWWVVSEQEQRDNPRAREKYKELVRMNDAQWLAALAAAK